MTWKGQDGWRPGSRRDRRRGGDPRKRTTQEKADNAFLILLVVFSLAALALVLAVAIFVL